MLNSHWPSQHSLPTPWTGVCAVRSAYRQGLWEADSTNHVPFPEKWSSQGRQRASLVAQSVKNLPAMWKTWVRSLGWEDDLEDGMATLSSVLARRIPWTEEPGGLRSTGSQRGEHDSDQARKARTNKPNRRKTKTPDVYYNVLVCLIKCNQICNEDFVLSYSDYTAP